MPVLKFVTKAATQPLNVATGSTAVLMAVFGVLREFNVGLTPGQEVAIIVAFAVIGNWLVGITGSAMLRKIIADPDVPTIDQTGVESPAAPAIPAGPAVVPQAQPGQWGDDT